MYWTLAPGVAFCIVGNDPIFLDVARDRYFLLSGERRAAFERLRMREPNDSDAMSLLLETGLFTRSEHDAPIEPLEVAVPLADLNTVESGRSGFRAILAAARALHWAGRALRPHRLQKTLSELSAAKRSLSASGEDTELISLAADFERSRTFVPVAPRCLIDSLALFRLALHSELVPTLVFGVRTSPFAAHCWLQSDSTILTGTAEEAGNYRPILAI